MSRIIALGGGRREKYFSRSLTAPLNARPRRSYGKIDNVLNSPQSTFPASLACEQAFSREAKYAI